jgi:signal transduction histidine kinase
VGYFSLNAIGSIVSLNLTGASMLGQSRSRLIGQRLERFVVSGDRASYQSLLRRANASGGVESCEIRMIDPTDSGLHVLVGCKAVVPEGQDGESVRLTVTDISSQKAAEKLEITRERLRRSALADSLAEERERRRIAIELHDDAGQILALARIKLSQAISEGHESNAALREALNLVTNAIAQTRRLTAELSPPILHEIGLEAALDWLAQRQGEENAYRVEFLNDGMTEPFDEVVRVNVFQAVREIMRNVSRHADAGKVTLRVGCREGNLQVQVEDDGTGFDPGSLRPDDGFGLFGIRERMGAIGGSLRIESSPGKGTRITLRAPLRVDLIPGR